MEKGFIKLYRDIVDWEWFDNPNCLALFIHCIILANWRDKKWHGIIIKRGQFVTSTKNLSNQTGLTYMQVRTALKKLEQTNEIKRETTNKYTIITVNNYNDYQKSGNIQKHNGVTNKQHAKTIENKALTEKEKKSVTNKQQSNNNQITTTKEVKEVKKHIYGENFEDSETIKTAKAIVRYYYFTKKVFDNYYGNEKEKLTSAKKSVQVVDRLLRLDNVTKKEFYNVIEFALQDDFWSNQLRGFTTLRKKGRNNIKKYFNIKSSFNNRTKNQKSTTDVWSNL
jgi:hypothetical protein